MNKKYRIITSISKDFWALTIFVVLCIVLLSAGFSFLVYKSYVTEKTDSLPKEASQIDYIFTDSIQYIDNYANFIGQRIAEHGSGDLKYIASLVGGKANATPNPQNLFISTLFDWVTPDKQMRVTSDRGIMNPPADMSHRDYLNRTPQFPWTLQLQDPAIGVPSGKWIIPGGVGITDAEGKYLGAVTLGFNIDGLAKKINASLGSNNMHFIILTKDFKYVGGTSGGKQTDDKYSFIRQLESHGNILADNAGFLKKSFEYENDVYPFYQKTSKYGYIILTGYSKNLPSEVFDRVLFPRLIEFLILGTAIVFLLFIFRKRTIEPLLELSKVVDKISKGEKVYNLPRSNVIELRNISSHLINVMRYMNREKHHKEQLSQAKAKAEEAVIIAREAKAAKEEFLRKLRHELKVPLTTILGYAEVMMTERFGKLPDTYKEVAENIFKSGYYIGTLMTSVLNRKLIETSKVIKQCISIHQDKAYFNKINYTVSINDDLPQIYVDEVRFRQIVVGVIHHSLTLTPPEENIHISANMIMKEQKPYELVITVKDTGFGGNEDFRKTTIDNAGPQGLSRNSDGTDLTIDNIHTLLALHNGTLTIESENRCGTTFIITIPYLDERDESFTTDIGREGKINPKNNVTPLFKDGKKPRK